MKSSRFMAANNSVVWHRRRVSFRVRGDQLAFKRVQYSKFEFIFSVTMELQLEHVRDILKRTPSTLNLLLQDLPEPWLKTNEGPDTWSPYDVVGHLIHGEETDWIPRAKMILENGESRAFTPFNREAMFEKSKGKSIDELLNTFAQLRAESLQQLDELKLTPEMLEKRGLHPELGPVTLSQLLATWVVHDLSHIGQIVRVMCKQYGETVGPWKAYLPVLTR